MRIISDISSPEVASVLNTGGIVILRTDTLYGVIARADDEQAVRRVYELKGRDETKSPIILIADVTDTYDEIPQAATATVNELWPGKVSIILSSDRAPSWIQRGNKSVAYRLPDSSHLRSLISQTGPLIAPSANPQGEHPAMTIEEAIDYFGESIDLYVDGGIVKDSTPSQIIRITSDAKIERLR